MSIETIQYLTTIKFGEGAAKALQAELTDLGLKRPLIVTDKPLVDLGLVGGITAGLDAPAPVFDGTPSNPTEAAVDQAVEMLRAHDCDSLVAIGGGSPIDLAKAVSLIATHPGTLAQYAAIEGGLVKITAECLPCIAIPTTSGTGAEVGRASLVTVADGRKLGLVSPFLIPARAICDPELTYALPAGLTAATGMDAITHCFETYLSPKNNPVAESIALDGLARGWSHILEATQDPTSTTARREMMMASLQGGLTFQKGLGAVHSLSHPLGANKTVNPHHGTLNAILLPAVLRHNAAAAPDKYRNICKVLGLAEDFDLGTAVEALTLSLKLPRTLSELGLTQEMLRDIPQAAMADHSTPTSPRKMTIEGFQEILDESF